MTASSKSFDFTDVKDRGEWNKKRQQEGDYRGEVTKVEDTKSSEDNVDMWVFTIEVGRGSYPYYCKHQSNKYWKLRKQLIAAGMSVPKKKLKVDPNKVVGKSIGVSLEDAEYNGRPQSEVGGVIPLSELDADDLADEDEDAGDDDEDAEEAPPKKSKKPKPAVDEDEDEEAEEAEEEEAEQGDLFDQMDRSELKQHIAKNNLDVKVFKSMDDDAIREAIRTASADDDDDLEEIDIDDT